MTGYSIRHIPFLSAFGILKPDRKTFFYAIPAIVIGLCLGILVRHKFGLSLLPATIGSLALISPIIGAFEELVFFVVSCFCCPYRLQTAGDHFPFCSSTI